mgnify:CR=1 FL=1
MYERMYELDSEQIIHNYIWGLKDVDDETVDRWIRQYKSGDHDPKLKEKIFGQYARYVMRMAHHYSTSLKTPVYNITDVFNEGYIAFERALETFDPDAGFKFLTYAGHWICRYMHRFTTMHGWECYLPAGLAANLKRAIAIRFKCDNQGREYSPKVLEEELEVSNRVAETLYKLSMDKAKSLNVTMPELDNEAEVLDILTYDDQESIEEEVTKEDRLENLIQIIGKVSKSEREKNIVLMRYGLPPYKRTYTLQEIGDQLDVSRERVRQLEKKTLKKMRDQLENKKEDYIF